MRIRIKSKVIHRCLSEMLSLILSSSLFFSCVLQGKEIHVAKVGNDANSGSLNAPYLSINKAASLAIAGDTITVHQGTYREWVKPQFRGLSEEQRIYYRAAEREEVIITGAESVKGAGYSWQFDENYKQWKLVLPKAFFGDFNPFSKLIRQDQYIDVEESSEGWGWLMYGRNKHRGNVYLNGLGFSERESIQALTEVYTWHAEVTPEDRFTVIWANFGDKAPNQENVEINLRPFGIAPLKSGLSYISIDGFTIKNIASSWAPPTVFQAGAVVVNGGSHWNIINNNITYSKGVCISIGLPSGEAEHSLSGHHIIKDNIMLRCGQAGIAGQSWGSHSTIMGNIIEDTNYLKEYGGWETAGIKLHNVTDVTISDNFIYGVSTNDLGAAHGIWIDYENTNFTIANNIIIKAQDAAIMLEANWQGPFLIENNILISGTAAVMSSVDDVWAHNLFVDVNGRWLNQTYGDRPAVKNAVWLNNTFISGGIKKAPKDADYLIDNNFYANNAKSSDIDINKRETIMAVQFDYAITDKGVIASFTVPDEWRLQSLPLVTAATTKHPIKRRNGKDAIIDKDFFGQLRNQQQIIAGPFAKLSAGHNQLTLYVFPERLAKLKASISGIRGN